MNKKTVIFIGRSGSGKGTQAKLLIEYIESNFPNEATFYNETGALFREFVEEKNYSNILAKEILDEGGREPDFLAIYLWSKCLLKNLKGDEHLIIDGTPRSLKEAEILDTALSFYGRNTDILNVVIGKEEAIKRLQKRARADDIELSDIEKRLAWFDADVTPAIEYYKTNGSYNYIEIEGEQDVGGVHKDIISKLF